MAAGAAVVAIADLLGWSRDIVGLYEVLRGRRELSNEGRGLLLALAGAALGLFAAVAATGATACGTTGVGAEGTAAAA